MTYFFEKDRIDKIKKYKNEIIFRLILSTLIYIVGVVLTFIFSKRELMYLLPILLGVYSTIYFGYLFFFIWMYYRNYKGNISFLKKLDSGDIKQYKLEALSVDSMTYNMYGVFCHGVIFYNYQTDREMHLYVPIENLEIFEKNKIYLVESYLSLAVGCQEVNK